MGAGLRWLLQLDDTPQSVARGVASGLFIAFTPTVGIQMFLVVILNTVIRANRLAGLAMVWITNPVTVIPIYWADYLVGQKLLRTEPIAFARFEELFQLESTGFFARFREFVEHLSPVLADVAVPLCLGGAIIGGVLAIASYPLTIWFVRWQRRGRERLEELKLLRRERQRARTESRVRREDISW